MDWLTGTSNGERGNHCERVWDKLPSFKVGDLQGPPRVKESKTGFKPPASEAQVQESMGFLRIEALLDEGNPEEISSNFNTLLDTLESEARWSANAGTKACAR